MKLTPQQEKAFNFIRDSSLQNGISPTLRELCQFMGYSAVGSAQDIVASLRRKGFLQQVHKRAARSFLLTEKGKIHGGGFDSESESNPTSIYNIPCLGQVPAGRPLEAIEDKIGSLAVSASVFSSPRPRRERLYALKAVGDSMLGAGIIDGDWLIVYCQQGANIGNIVVARTESGDATVKRLEKDGKGWYLKPENPNYPILHSKDVPFEILGKVIALQRLVRA